MFTGRGQHRMLLGDIIKRLNEAYCNTLGVEFMYDQMQHTRNWISEEVESADRVFFTKEERINILQRLAAVEALEILLRDKLPQEMRLSVWGLESGIIAVQELIKRACWLGADTFIIGN